MKVHLSVDPVRWFLTALYVMQSVSEGCVWSSFSMLEAIAIVTSSAGW